MAIFLSVLVVLTCYFMLSKISVIDPVRLNLESYILFVVIFISMFGSVVFYATDANYAERYISGQNVAFLNLVSVSYVSLVFVATFYMWHRIFPLNTSQNRMFRENLVTHFGSDQVFIYMTLLLILALACVYSYSSLDLVPVVEMVTGGDLKAARYSSKFGYQGSGLIRNLLLIKLSIILSGILLSYALTTVRFRVVCWIMFCVSFCLAILGVTFFGSKAPLIMLFMSYYCVYIYSTNSRPRVAFYVLSTVLVTIIVGLFYLMSGSVGVDLYSGFISRLLVIPILGHILSLQYFPSEIDFLHGQSFPRLFTELFGYESVRSSALIMEAINPEGVANSTAGVVSSLYSAEAYANFGWIGMFLAPILVASVVFLIKSFVLRLRPSGKSPEKIALYGYIIMYLPFMGGFVDFFWNVSLVFVFICTHILFYTRLALGKGH